MATDSLEDRLSLILSEARAHRKNEEYAQALEKYAQVFEESRPSAGFAGVRLSYVLSESAQIAEKFPAAREWLADIQSDRERQMLEGNGEHMVVMEWVAVCDCTDAARILQFYDQLNEMHDRQAIIAKIQRLRWQLFIRARRYGDLSEDFMRERFEKMLKTDQLHRAGSTMLQNFPEHMHESLIDFGRITLLKEGRALFEYAVAQGNEKLAQDVRKAVLQRETSGKFFAALVGAAMRANSGQTVGDLLEQAQAELSKEDMKLVEQAREHIECD